jgi:hypothetical protein
MSSSARRTRPITRAEVASGPISRSEIQAAQAAHMTAQRKDRMENFKLILFTVSLLVAGWVISGTF